MRNFFQKIRYWFSSGRERATIWYSASKMRINPNGKRVRPIVKYAGSLLLIGLALLGTILFVRSREKDNKTDSSPEVAQVYEPSIGSALPPDFRGSVSGDVTPSPAPSPTPTPAMAPTTGVNLSEQFVAPNAGVDPNDPVEYVNPTFGFTATLPPGSNVEDKNGAITFITKQDTWYYSVMINDQRNVSLQELETQLKNSPSVRNLKTATFQNSPALQFTSSDLGGPTTVFIKNGKVYYLIGNIAYFSSFKTI